MNTGVTSLAPETSQIKVAARFRPLNKMELEVRDMTKQEDVMDLIPEK